MFIYLVERNFKHPDDQPPADYWLDGYEPYYPKRSMIVIARSEQAARNINPVDAWFDRNWDWEDHWIHWHQRHTLEVTCLGISFERVSRVITYE